MIQELKHDESESLSYSDLKKIMAGRIAGLKIGFVDLENTPNITMERILPAHRNAAFILLTHKDLHSTQRHWSVLIKNGHGFMFWESLAMKPAVLGHKIDNNRFIRMLKRHKCEF